jgi:drug/metabolite transporter (DMT)-like permease
MLTHTKPGVDRTVLRFGLLLFGVLCGSSAVILIKATNEHPFLVASYRLLVAALVLSPFFFRDLRASAGGYGLRQIGWSALPAVILAVHFMSWVIGVHQTQVANASLIVNLTPVAIPFFLWMFYREKINREEVLGTLFALAGLVALGWSSIRVQAGGLTGDLICFGSMLGYAAYLALGRKNGGRISLWLYMVPLYAIAGVICLLCALPFVNPIKPYALKDVLLIVGLGILPTVIGHTVLNYSLKHFRGQVVSVTNLTQPIFAGWLGYLIFKEAPRPSFYLSAVLVVVGVGIILVSGYRKRTKDERPGTKD